MILTNCAACAAPLAHDHKKRCSRCKTRYCNEACQRDHWERGGHEALCRRIKRAGGAEQYHADKNYKEAVAVAVEACAEDTKGQTCFICTQALHWKTKEGLVRGCSCRGTAGFAHVSCLVEQAKILFAEAQENNLDLKVQYARWDRWSTCSLCEQDYHGVVACALGWACWKTYLGRPETDAARSMAMNLLGNGLYSANHIKDALSVKEAELAMMRRLGGSEEHMLVAQTNLSNTYAAVGRREEALRMQRDVYFGRSKLFGEEHPETVRAANNYALSLLKLQRYTEAKSLLRRILPVARRVLKENDMTKFGLESIYAEALYRDPDATLDDLREAVNTLENTERTVRRILGGAHPLAVDFGRHLQRSRAALRSREQPSDEKEDA